MKWVIGVSTLLVAVAAAGVAKMAKGKSAKPSSTDVMKAVSYEKHGAVATDVLKFTDDYPKPIPGRNQVLVQIKASSVNPVDFKLRRNSVPSFMLPKPKIPGADLAGIIVECPSSSSTQFQVGDRVAAMIPLTGSRWGSNAEYVAVDTSLLAKIPDNVSFESAAAVPLVSLTVMQSLNKLKKKPQPKKILIHAGAGGVGSFAIQYAKHVLGMETVATTASKEKADYLKQLGADVVIDYHTEDFTAIVQDYDVVLDPMSFLYETKTLKSNVLNKKGHYLNIMSSDWGLTEDGKEKSYGAITGWHYIKHKTMNLLTRGWFVPNYDFCIVKPNGEHLQTVMDLLGNNTIQPVIDSKFPLSKLADAHAHLEGGHVTGKTLTIHRSRWPVPNPFAPPEIPSYYVFNHFMGKREVVGRFLFPQCFIIFGFARFYLQSCDVDRMLIELLIVLEALLVPAAAY
eukprot:scaffold22613_cov126-Cylindrotheca_fusiformis.AAC.11